MIYRIISFGNLVFDTAKYTAILDARDNPVRQPSVELDTVRRGAGAPPVAGKFVFAGDRLIVTIVLRTSSTDDYQEFISGVMASAAERRLVGQDENGAQWYVNARLASHTSSGVVHKLAFDVPDPVWRSMTAVNVSWTVTSSGQTNALTVGGTYPAKPTITISPRSAKSGGFGYARWVGVYNRTDGALNYALDITSSAGRGLNTAALISGGKMQEDGDDLWVYVDGVPVTRWLAGINTSATGVVIPINLSPRVELTLKTAIAASGAVSSIAVNTTSANLEALKKLDAAANKLVMIDNEVFSYASVDTKNYLLTGVARAQRWTSMASHAANATIRWIEHDIYMLYGNAALNAPENDISRKPLWDINTSTNTSWVYNEFYDADNPSRPCGWTAAVLSSTGKQSHAYTDTHGGSINPAIKMGMRALAYMSNGVWKAETAQIEWRWINPCCATNVSASGSKYMYLASWGSKAGLQKSSNGTSWTDVWNEAKPTVAKAWQTFTRTAFSLSGSFPYLRFYNYASIAASAGNESDIEIDGGLSIMLDSAKTPAVMFGAEQPNYWMETIIRCQETSDEIWLRGLCEINDTIIVDCANKTVTKNGENAYWMLSLNTVRGAWMDLPVGTATIEIIDEGLTNVDVAIEYEERTTP